MPEIDLPTVIFALVALFVAYKLRSVLGMRQDSDVSRAAFSLRCAAVPAPAGRPCRPAGGRAVRRSAPPPAADRWKGVAEPDPAVWSGLDAIAAADRELFAAGLSVRRARSLTTWSSMPSPPAIRRRCAT